MSERAKPLARSVHETPSGLVSSVPPAPTVTQRPPPNATAARFGVPRGLALVPIVPAVLGVALTLGLGLTLALALALGLALGLPVGLALGLALGTIGVGRADGAGRGVTGG